MDSNSWGSQWHELKSKLKATFGQLTDDDLLQIEGSAARTVGVLQTRYGYSKEQAQQEWENFARQHVITTEDTYQQMADTAKPTR